jgi:hypothetical protein
MTNDTMTERIIGSALKVHSGLGAGCLESTYHACLGLLINFNVAHLRQGIRRVVNNYEEKT